MTKESLKAACDLIIEEDDLRPWMSAPRNIQDHFFATNGYMAIYGPLQGIEEPFPDDFKETVPKAIDVVKENLGTRIEKELKVSEIRAKLKQAPHVDEMDYSNVKECDACRGDGEVLWEFSHKGQGYEEEFDCPICHGSGEIGVSVKTGRKVLDPYLRVDLFGVRFMGSRFQLTLDVLDALKEPIFRAQWTNKAQTNITLELGGALNLIIMGAYRRSTDKVLDLTPEIKHLAVHS